jgi:hypothetical protein
MVLRLIGDVFPEGTLVTWADGKCAVSGLPMEGRELLVPLVNPRGRAGLYLLHDIGDAFDSGKRQ